MPVFPRHLSASLHTALQDTPVVCLLGPRQCGKTGKAACCFMRVAVRLR